MVVKSRKKSGRGHSISKVKRNNQRRTKLIKQGKMKVKRNKRITDIKRNPRKQKKTEEQPEEMGSGSEAEDMAGMVEADDIDFLKKAVCDRSYSMLKRLRYTQPKDSARKRRVVKEEDDEIEAMEAKFEDHLEGERAEKKPMKELLPIKTKEGIVRRTTLLHAPKVEPKIENQEDGDDDADEEGELEEGSEAEEDSRIDLSQPVSTAQLLGVRQKQLNRYRISIGSLASGLLEDPQGKFGNLKKLLALMTEPQPSEVALTVPRLAAVSLLEVFKDLLPEYPIRSTDQSGVMLKKETLELRKSEQGLLAAYKQYLTYLEKLLQPLSKKLKPGERKAPSTVDHKQKERLALVSLKCLGQMLETRPSFNFSHNIARLLVPLLDHRSCAEARASSSASLAATLKQDKRGDISLEIARRVNALVKARATSVRPESVLLLLNLRIKDVDLDAARQAEAKHKKLESRKRKMMTTSKRERKRTKRLEELNKELLETQAEEDKQTRQRNFTETTKLAFTVFFRVLKSEPRPALLAATLEGLAKFSHCINVEVYGDLVRVLEALLSREDPAPLPLHLKLLCVQTLLAIISGHGQFLTIDPARFHAHLYRCLLPLAAGSTQDELGGALGPLHSVFVTRRKSVSQQRLLAFTKRLASLACHQQHHGALACLQLVKSALQLSRGTDILLETDNSGGQGRYLPELEEPEHCNAGDSALYELTLMQRHYHPTVATLAKYVAHGAPAMGDVSLAPALDKKTCEELYKEYEPREMAVKPSVPSPHQFQLKQRLHFSVATIHNRELQSLAEEVIEDEDYSKVNFYKEMKI